MFRALSLLTALLTVLLTAVLIAAQPTHGAEQPLISPVLARATFDLNIEIFRGTVWTEALVRKKIDDVNRVFAVCNVSVGQVHMNVIEPPTGELNLYRDLSEKGPHGLRSAASMLGRTSTLTLMLIRQFHEGLAGTAGIPHVYENTFPEMVNRAWVTEEILEPGYLADRDVDYVPVAHELGHILLNAGHDVSGRKNLMAASHLHVNGELDPAQCAQLRLSPLVHQR